MGAHAGHSATMGAAPLTLRDFLELACESSCSDGFRSYPRRLLPCPVSYSDDARQEKLKAETAPVHLLIEADLRRSPSRTLSSILFPRSPRSLAAISRLSRSLSRRLVFWRRHRDDDDDDSERDSLGLPSPVVSSCSASEYAESEAEAPGPPPADAEEGKPASKPSPSSSSGSVNADDGAATGVGNGHKEQLTDGGDAVGSTEEEKQQLSPVSVMDLPFHDDDEETSDAGTCSPATSFQHCLPDPERSNKAQAQELLLHKILRLDGLAQAVGPVDLEAQFSTESDHQSAESDDTHTQTSNCSSTSAYRGVAATWSPRCRSADSGAEREPDEPHSLLSRLLKDDDGTVATTSAATERLLHDFFAEGLDPRRSSSTGPVVGALRSRVDDGGDNSALVRAAQEWVQGAGTRWGAEDVLFAGEAALADMERGRQWACVAEEEREVGTALGELVMDVLVAELVRDLALAARC